MDIYKLLEKEEFNYEDIKEIRKYHLDTYNEGIVISNYQEFINKIFLIVKLWPQKEKNNINYLFGGELAIELALQGNVLNRRKNNHCYPLKKHSEIVLYDVKEVELGDTKGSANVKDAYGNIEYYSGAETKSLSNLDKGLLDKGYDTVIINNEKILIPELEILFLDSYLQKELNPRKEGYDYELLLMEYELDTDKIINYLEEYYINPKINNDKKHYDQLLDKQIKAIERILNNGGKIITNLENLESQVNLFPKGKNMTYAGILIDLWIPLGMNNIVYKNKYYVIEDEKYLEKLKKRIEIYSLAEYQRYEELVVEIKNITGKNQLFNI